MSNRGLGEGKAARPSPGGRAAGYSEGVAAVDIVEIAKTLGIPATILGVLLWAVWRSGSWLAVEVLKPLTASHVDLMESIKSTQERQADTLDQIAQTQSQQAQYQADHANELRAVRAALEKRT